MVSRRALGVAIGTVLLAWLMISSIHLVQPTASQGGSNSNPDTSNSDPNGSSQGGGVGFPNLGGFSLFKFPTFNFSFNFPDLFHFPKTNLTLPVIANQSSPGFGQGVSGEGSGETGGGGTGQGTNNGGNANTGTPRTNDPPQFVIPTELLIIAAVIALIIAGTGFVVSQRKNLSRRRPNKASTIKPTQIALEAQNPAEKTSPFDPNAELLGEEIVADFSGWGNVGFIKPSIREDLPLIWSTDEPLTVAVPEGAKIFLSGSDLPTKSSSGGSPNQSSFDLALSVPCNKISAEFKGEKEEKWIRAVHYNEDIAKLFRLNLLNSSGFDLKSMTARELANHMVTQNADVVKDKNNLFGLTKIFERAYYGKKEIGRKEYEAFLNHLSGALKSPKVIICAPRDRESKSDQ